MKEENFSGKVSMINRLATFIEAATEELEEANAKLAKMAVTDTLTGLLNRGEIQRRISTALKDDKGVSLVMLDIDNFKSVNDTFGHKEGDNVIKGLCKCINDVLAKDTAEGQSGRWGGEEFMVLLCGDDCAKADIVAEHIRQEFESMSFPDSRPQSVSIGVTDAQSGENVDAAVMRADDALYTAKNNGRNNVVRK